MVDLYPAAIDSDVEMPPEESSDEEADEGLTVRKKKKVVGATAEFSADFMFTAVEKQVDKEANDLKKYLKKTVSSTLEDRIAAERKKKNTNAEVQVEAEDGGSLEDVVEEERLDVVQLAAEASDSMREKRKKGKSKVVEEEKFFEEIGPTQDILQFDQMNLSRPILKAVSASGFTDPTPIQSACIPVALAGRDICACAATGTGKTGAFVLPILERLLYRPSQRSVTRVLVLVPTRELAIQVFQVFRKLSLYSPVDVCLCAGGLDLKTQEAALRAGPDIVVATPGRLIDHLHNAPTFTLDTIEVLVLDEADRILEHAFEDQMNEIIKMCSGNRQTLLFSATMSDQIEQLAAVSLKKPVKIFVNENSETAMRLRQEFIRIRQNRESDREAVTAALVTRTFQEQTMVFVSTKKDCQRLHILLGLLGIKVGQLHSSLTQTMRVEALHKFKRRELDVLVSTDLASRGLDIEGVQTVINMCMPPSMKAYIHRVGRTARAGKAGRSISLVGEEDRKLLKEIVKANPDKALKQRVVAPEVVEAYRNKVEDLGESITRIDEDEKAERQLKIAEDQMKRTEDILKNGPQEREDRKWYKKPTELDKLKKREEKQQLRKLELKNARKNKTSEDVEIEREMAYQARCAKRQRQTRKLRTFDDDDHAPSAMKHKKKSKKSSFTEALADVSRQGYKKARAGPQDDDFRRAKVAHRKGGMAAKGKGKGGKAGPPRGGKVKNLKRKN